MSITGAADIVVASDCATFALPEVDRGAMGGGAHLQRFGGSVAVGVEIASVSGTSGVAGVAGGGGVTVDMISTSPSGR